MPRIKLLGCFTTLCDVGVYRAFNDVAMRDAIAHGYIIGPRMFVAGAYITISEGAGAMTGLAWDIPLPLDLRYGEANSPWEVRQKIRELAHRGADHIKILSTGAVLTHGSNPKSLEFTPEELNAAVDEARNFGLRVEAHAHAAEGIKNAIRAGVASIEHATLIDDEGIALAKQHGTYLDMDIYDEECIQDQGKKNATPADFLEHDRGLGELHRRNFTKAVRAGVKMSFGTDAGVCPHGINARQFAFMVKYGMTPMQAIQSATSNAADLLGKSDLLGSLKPGKYADIIAVSGNPLDDVRILENVKFVMKEGQIYKQEP
jgi:imidazolonepropionase-like amidohydrolase